MKGPAREGLVITGVVSVLLMAWLGFFVHRSPRFAGSGTGAVFGVAAAVFMLFPLAYTIAKRFPSFTARMAARASLKTLLDLHVYAGLLAVALAIVHSGHRLESRLGTALMALLLLVVVSGYAVRYLLTFVAHGMQDKLALLQTARGDLDHAWGVLEMAAAQPAAPASAGLDMQPGDPAREVTRIAEAVADLEYSVRMNEVLKRWFGRCLRLHIVVSTVFYGLLALHIGAAVQYGLRWLS